MIDFCMRQIRLYRNMATADICNPTGKYMSIKSSFQINSFLPALPNLYLAKNPFPLTDPSDLNWTRTSFVDDMNFLGPCPQYVAAKICLDPITL